MFVVDLNRVQANPWQTRDGYDEAYILELGQDIARRQPTQPHTRGLLQVPLARIVNGDGQPVSDSNWSFLAGDATAALEKKDYYVQIAFGHNRLAAFRRLAAGDVDHVYEQRQIWTLFPLEYAGFDDEEMASVAWEENAQRKDLSPLEEAQSIRRALDSFGWTQAELGQRWGMAPSTISNKLKLLKLPEEITSLVDVREISERQAMALAPVFELPPAAMEKARSLHRGVDYLVASARDGANSDGLRSDADRLIEQATRSLKDAPFPRDHPFEGDEIQAARCDECSIVVRHKRKKHCPDSACWDAKEIAWKAIRLAAASEATGLPIADEDKLNYRTREVFYSSPELGREIYETGECECLQLEWAGDRWSSGGVHLDDKGFSDIRVICFHEEDKSCECLRKKRAQRTRERNENDPEIQERRRRERQVQEIVVPAYDALAEALKAGHTGAYLLVLRALNSSYCGKGDGWDLDKVMLKIAEQALAGDLSWRRDKPGQSRQSVIKYFDEAGLPLPWGDDDNPLAGKITQLDRIEGWMRKMVKTIPQAQAVVGNITNLQKVRERLNQSPSLEECDALRERADGLLEILNDTLPIVERWSSPDAPGWQEWRQHGSWLVTVPSSDINFKSHLQSVTHASVIEYAGALLKMHKHQKTKLQILERRLRALEANEEGGDDV